MEAITLMREVFVNLLNDEIVQRNEKKSFVWQELQITTI